MTTSPGLSTPAEVRALLAFPQGPIGADLETTGVPGKGQEGALNPATGRVRLLSVSDGITSLVMDCAEHDPRQLWPEFATSLGRTTPELAACTIICHNAVFDLSFLVALGLHDLPDCHDTYLLSLLLDGAGHPAGYHSLAGCCRRWLGLELDKTHQTADWSGPLTEAMVEYSRRDAAVLVPLLAAMRQECGRRGLAVLKLTWR